MYPALHVSYIGTGLAIANTDTLVQSLAIPAGILQAGACIRITALGTCVPSALGAGIFTVRAGTAGSTADANIGQFTTDNSSNTGATTAFGATIVVSVRSATVTAGSLLIVNESAALGIIAKATGVYPDTEANLSGSTATFVDLTYKSGNANITTTFQNCVIEVLPI